MRTQITLALLSVISALRSHGDDLDLGRMLAPVSRESKLQDDDYFIWGGSMVRDADGRCHLFYSRWPGRTGFGGWVTHSEIAHAVAGKPTGPYRHVDVALPVRGAQFWDGLCTHNPSVHEFEGKYYLYYMGNTGDGRNTAGLNWTHRNNQRVGVAVADHPNGPWRRLDKPVIDVSEAPDAPDALMASNPAICRRPDGMYVLVYKCVGKHGPMPFGGPVVHMVATSDAPTGPFQKHPEPVFTAEGHMFPTEDPYIWSGDDRLWAVLKDKFGLFTGVQRSLALFQSSDGVQWEKAKHPLVSGPQLNWENGEVQKLEWLDRPQLWFDDGGPAVLFCAAKSGGQTFNVHIPLSSETDTAGVKVSVGTEGATLENDYMGRVLMNDHGRLRTGRIVNKRAGTVAVPTRSDEFRLRISQGTDRPGTDILLTAEDFTVEELKAYEPEGALGSHGIAVKLSCEEHGLTATIHYELEPDDFYMRKFITLSSMKSVTLERIDVDCLSFSDAQQPYQLKCIYARGKWAPGLGQPLYTIESGTFWGIEFPAAYNYADGQQMFCGYLWGRELEPGTPYTSYKAVCGVADDPHFMQEVFFDYVNRIRMRPLRLQVQYNSWFDFGSGVNQNTFTNAVAYIHKRLVEKRGTPPLKAYVIDDGWQNTGVSWTDKTWKVNSKFDKDFAASFKASHAAKSNLGLWLSPGCNFGARHMVPRYREAGFEALDNYMSLAGPKYMGLLEDRMVELTRLGVTYFKLDGLFGHLHTRDFELHGGDYGLPEMPQLDLDGIGSSDSRRKQ